MTLARINLIFGSVLGFFFTSFLYLCIDDLKNLSFLIPILVLSFGVYKYVENNKYLKKKDTYEYIDKNLIGKLVPLICRMNERMIYFDHFFKLSVKERLSHKEDVQSIHLFLTDLNSKIEQNLFDRNVLSSYLNENFKKTLLNLLMHFDVTFLSHPFEIKMLYENLFNDFDQFSKKVDAQRQYFIKYHKENIADIVETEIEGEKHTLNEWCEKTSLRTKDCSKKDELLHQLQILKQLYPNNPGFYLSLGNLFYFCFADYERSIKFLKHSIELDENFVEPYINLIMVEYDKSKNLDSALHVLNKAPKIIVHDDRILNNKAVLYLKEKMYDKCEETAKEMKNDEIKNKFLNCVKNGKNEKI